MLLLLVADGMLQGFEPDISVTQNPAQCAVGVERVLLWLTSDLIVVMNGAVSVITPAAISSGISLNTPR